MELSKSAVTRAIVSTVVFLARRLKLSTVTDERSAKKQCLQMMIPITGTLAILKALVLDGYLKLDQADKILSKMTDTGFYSPLRSIVDII